MREMIPLSEARGGCVVDIGGSSVGSMIRRRLIHSLKTIRVPDKTQTLPDELLYDDTGLPLWGRIIFTPSFYQTHDEIAILQKHSADIVSRVQPGVTLIDLGARDTRKVEHLLSAFEDAEKPATYLALDVSKASLESNISYLHKKHPASQSVVRCVGLWGDFRQGKDHVQRIPTSRLFLSLGSVLCNDPWPVALEHLRYWASIMRSDDLLLVGMDGHQLPKDADKIWSAYHDRPDLFTGFFLNGFRHSNKLVGAQWFRREDWDFEAQLEAEPTMRHRFFLRARTDIKLAKIRGLIPKGTEIDWFDSHKYGEDSVRLLCSKAGLTVIHVWRVQQSNFLQYLVKIKGQTSQHDDADSGVSDIW